MTPEIIQIKAKVLVGMKLEMDLMDNKTELLWQRFSPRMKNIPYSIPELKYSLQIYPDDYFKQFKPDMRFVKWAAVEVFKTDGIPAEMEVLTLEAGLYAVFHYKGSGKDHSIFQYIYSQWVPNSKFTLDNRPHFEVLGKNYSNTSAASEEDIYIPIKVKMD